MTDAELVRSVAERVMGWTYRQRSSENTFPMWEFRSVDGVQILASPHELTGRCRWWPLSSKSDAFQLVDALHAKGWRLILEQHPSGFWSASLLKGDDFKLAVEPDVCRAITIACARAAGVEEVTNGK